MTSVILKNETAEFEMTLEGSAFTKFRLTDNPINPLDWRLPKKRLPDTNIGSFLFQGHFLCLGTWGMPTDGEKKAGLKFYGEGNTEVWKITKPLHNTDTSQSITTVMQGPIERLDVTRTLNLYNHSSVVEVTEEVTNNLPIGRPYNILQHATMGGRFINQKTILNTNAGKGFYQNAEYKRSTYTDIEETSYEWPNALVPDGEIDLTLSNQVQKSFVSTHIFPENETHGWATLTNVEAGLLIGYIWDKKDYPWLNVWHQYEEGKVKGRAIEFATCGMWQPFEYMMSNDSRFFGQNSFEFIDAGETKHKTYFMFLLPIDSNFTAVENIKMNTNSIDITINNEGKTKTQALTF
ncbi:hypothetical protein [Tamlana sp. I1]|uniref:hypothetical protein n=1 Tax=Tamlana sp. I1 TaxID=2762061 RepID=UPI00188F3E16|nr:hypothetical protein [Tamlana sp. I1]